MQFADTEAVNVIVVYCPKCQYGHYMVYLDDDAVAQCHCNHCDEEFCYKNPVENSE
jgi:hypothetical protein